MHSRIRLLITAVAVGACLATAAVQTSAQNYPERPIRMAIPFGAGGPSDIVARIVAQKMSEFLPQPVVVENKPGAAGGIAHTFVAKASPDGYTLLFSGFLTGFAINPVLFPKTIQYNPREDFTAIGNAASGAVFMYVNASLPVRNMKELIALAKSKPGSLAYGSSGAGNFPSHVGAELLKKNHGIDILHVPYKGAGQAMADVAAGRVAFLLTTGLAAAKPFLDTGRVRALAVTGKKRASVLPDVPTFTEAGSPLPELDTGAIWGVVGPAGLPRGMVMRLNEALNKTLASPDVLARFAALDMDPLPGTPEASADLINNLIASWEKVLKRIEIKVN